MELNKAFAYQIVLHKFRSTSKNVFDIFLSKKTSLARLLSEKFHWTALWRFSSDWWPVFSGHPQALIILSSCTMTILK